jgi:hypothetical protein
MIYSGKQQIQEVTILHRNAHIIFSNFQISEFVIFSPMMSSRHILYTDGLTVWIFAVFVSAVIVLIQEETMKSTVFWI